ncbi:MAG: sigma-54-dependent Fis family transcriptional regulator [Acidithiobacillus sp.]|nr:sigma-54-dependent Fis family transcriptional regulator [Acidithiobacillus sp.]
MSDFSPLLLHALVVDDEVAITELLDITLSGMGFTVATANLLQDALQLLHQQSFQLCLTDLRLPDGSGIDLVRQIHQLQPELPVAVITAYSSTEGAVEAMQAGAFDFMTKPIELPRLRRLVQQAKELGRTVTPAPGSSLDRLVGQSRAMVDLREQIRLLGRSNAPVFIAGESGTGKELCARAIHDMSPRRGKAFVAVNCGAIPEALVESELFGSEKGAFTGAAQRREGLFLKADGGTLFLDEIGELPMTVQVKLLRALQERSIRPVGASSEIPIDIRLITATHRNLQEMVNNQTFRSDLYYRIHVVPLQIPPLRERREDIPILVQTLVARIAKRQGRQAPTVSAEALRWLQQQNFPGNVRELENLLEYALAMGHGTTLEREDLVLPGSTAPKTKVTTEPLRSPLVKCLARAEALLLQEEMTRSRQNHGLCAASLGISPRSLALRQQRSPQEDP